MGRLIDADAFEEYVRKHCKDSLADLWCELIRRQPTAYDVGKVVERLEEEKNMDRSKVYTAAQCTAIRFSFGAALEIVKAEAGGTAP